MLLLMENDQCYSSKLSEKQFFASSVVAGAASMEMKSSVVLKMYSTTQNSGIQANVTPYNKMMTYKAYYVDDTRSEA